MRARNLILAVVLCGSVGGCAWIEERWPWRKPDVPVTPATGQTPPPPDEPAPSPPATTPPAPPEPPPAPAPEPPPAKTEPPEPVGKTDLVAAPGLLINDRFVTVEEILRTVADPLAAIGPDVSEQDFRREASRIIRREMDQQVYKGMVLPEARARLAEGQLAAIDKEVAAGRRAMIAQFDGSLKKLQDYYLQRGTTLKEILDAERNAMIVQAFLRMEFAPAISVNRPMLWRHYQKNKKSKYTVAHKVQMQMIAIPFRALIKSPRASRADRAAAKIDAQKLIAEAGGRLRAGMDFAEVARKYSKGPFAAKGGVWRAMEAGSFRDAAVEKAAFDMTEGQVSDILTTDVGCYIVKAKKVYPGKVVGFEEAQVEIERELREQQYARLQQEYFNRKFASATVHTSQEMVRLGTDRAVERYWRKGR